METLENGQINYKEYSNSHSPHMNYIWVNACFHYFYFHSEDMKRSENYTKNYVIFYVWRTECVIDVIQAKIKYAQENITILCIFTCAVETLQDLSYIPSLPNIILLKAPASLCLRTFSWPLQKVWWKWLRANVPGRNPEPLTDTSWE